MFVKTFASMKLDNINYSLKGVVNEDGNVYYQFFVESQISWTFKAYEYDEEEIRTYPIIAPFGMSEGKYEEALHILISQFDINKVA